MRSFILGVMCLVACILEGPLTARTVQFEDKNFSVEVPDNCTDVPVPKDGPLIYEAQIPNGGFTIAYMDGAQHIESDDFAPGFIKGVEEKGSVVKSSNIQNIDGKKFFTCDLLIGSKASATYLIAADGRTLILSYYRPASTDVAVDRDPIAAQFIHSFHFLHPPVYPAPEKPFAEKMGEIFGYVIIIFGFVYAVAHVTRKKKVA